MAPPPGSATASISAARLCSGRVPTLRGTGPGTDSPGSYTQGRGGVKRRNDWRCRDELLACLPRGCGALERCKEDFRSLRASRDSVGVSWIRGAIRLHEIVDLRAVDCHWLCIFVWRVRHE